MHWGWVFGGGEKVKWEREEMGRKNSREWEKGELSKKCMWDELGGIGERRWHL